MRRLGLFIFTIVIVGLTTYALMRFGGRTPLLNEALLAQAKQVFTAPHTTTIFLDTLEKASLMAQRSEDPNVIKSMFDKISYNLACIQILEQEVDSQKLSGLIFSYMMKDERLSIGYTRALDYLRENGKMKFIDHTLRPNIALGVCPSKLTDAEKQIYLQQWKDLVVKNRMLQSKN